MLHCRSIRRYEQKETNIPAQKVFHQVLFAGCDTSQSTFHFVQEAHWSKEKMELESY